MLSFVANELNGWPLLHSSQYTYDDSKENTFKTIIKLFEYGVSPLFNVFVSPSPADPNTAVIRMSQASWFLIKDYYDDLDIMRGYKNFIVRFLRIMNSNSSNLEDEVNRMVNIEKMLAKNLLSTEERRKSTFKATTLRSLNQSNPNFNWKEFLSNGLFKGLAGLDIYENDVILVNDWNYITNAVEIYNTLINENSRRDLDNLLVWIFVKGVLEYLPEKYNKATSGFKKYLPISTATQSRSLFCTRFVGNRMDFAVGRLYVSEYFESGAKNHALTMVNNLKDEFKTMLNEYDWMDENSKRAAREKAEFIDVKIGYPEYTYDDQYLNSLYAEYRFSEIEYFENSLLADKIVVLNNLKELRKKVDRTSWLMGPAEVNAYYSASFNQICFPAGILQLPFYDSQTPNYLNYGGIGSVIGHEITHGFDDKGRSFDKNGVFHVDGGGLWSNATIEAYKRRSKCIIDQYSRFLVKPINKTMNGFQTQGENIADNGGIKESFRAYKKWSKKYGEEPLLPGLNYNQEQLFFINFAQVWCGKYKPNYLRRAVLANVHSLGEFRVFGTTQNSHEFAKAFQCKPNQKNNPTNKCSIW